MAETLSIAPTFGVEEDGLGEESTLSPEIPFLRRFNEASRSVIMSPPPPPPDLNQDFKCVKNWGVKFNQLIKLLSPPFYRTSTPPFFARE